MITSLRSRMIAGATAAAVALTPAAAMASDEPLEPRPNEYSVGQSVQIRTDANGVPNSHVTNFRWSITQIGAEGDGETFTATVPEDGLLLRSLQDFSRPPQEGGWASYEIDLDETGFGTARSVSLYPPDDYLPVEISTEFTLDGEPILAQDLVGKSGVVTASYTVRNLTRSAVNVPITSVTGDEIEKSVEADVPMVVEATSLIPDRYSGLNTGIGLGGADGRGNVQVKWIALPFAPLSADGTATFGWAANVRDAVIPSMLVQVLPLYIPPHGDEDDAEDTAQDIVDAAERAGVPPPNVSADVAQIKSGLENVVGGLEQLTSGGGDDPLDTVEGALNDFFQTFGDNIQNIADSLNPDNPDGVTAQLIALQALLDDANAQLAELQTVLTDENLDNLQRLANNWPQLSRTIQGLNDILPGLIEILETGNLPFDCTTINPAGTPAEGTIGLGSINLAIANREGYSYQAPPIAYRDIVERDPTTEGSNAYISTGGGLNVLTSGGLYAPVETTQEDGSTAIEWGNVGLTSAACSAMVAAAPGLIPNLPQVKDLLEVLTAIQPVIAQLASIPALSPENAEQVQQALNFLARNLSGIVTTLIPLTASVSTAIGGLITSITELQQQVEIIAAGLQDTNVDLPALDEVVAGIVEQILSSPGGQQLTSGLDDVSGGLGGVKAELATWTASLAVAIQSGVAAAKDALENGKANAAVLVDKVDTLKASVGGILVAAQQSPLPYGGDPTEAPEGTKLAGAYEFRMDPADHEQPSTLPRILIALILLIVGGFVGNWAASQRKPAVAMAGGGSTGPTPEGWAPWGAAAAGAGAGAATATAAMTAVEAETGADDSAAGGEPATEEAPVEAPAEEPSEAPTEAPEAGDQPGDEQPPQG